MLVYAVNSLGFSYRRPPGEQFSVRVIEEFLRKVWSSKERAPMARRRSARGRRRGPISGARLLPTPVVLILGELR